MRTSLVPFCVKALMEHEVPAHHYRLWGSAINEPPTDAHFRVKTIGWWGMTETITHGTIGNAHLPDLPMSMGRPAPEYTLKVTTEDGRPAEPGETGDLAIKGDISASSDLHIDGAVDGDIVGVFEAGFHVVGIEHRIRADLA